MTKKPLLMIIDDLKSNRLIIKKVLQNNYNFIEAANGIEAINLLKYYTPDIIIIDAIMPKMDGFEAIKNIRSNKKYKRTPILMITSLSNQKMKIKALESGVSDFLTKPFDKYELRARCKSYTQMVKLNKLYENTKLNPISKFKNELALIKEIVPNDSIFLFSINDFNKVDGVFGYKLSQYLEKKFGHFLERILKDRFGKVELYHINEAKFIVKLDKSTSIKESELENICKDLYNQCTKEHLQIGNIKYTPYPTIIFAKDRINLYEDALSALSFARKNNIKYLFSSDDINGIKDIVYSNIEILKKVKHAISNNNIINLYQPIYDNKEEKITHYETLVRLRCENNTLLSPAIFLEVAKNAQLYEEITKTVYKNAFDEFKFNNKNFSINISYLDIENDLVRNFLYEMLKENPHVSDRICFEIIEDKMLHDYSLIKEFTKEVRRYGAQVAIDNYGKIFSSFTSLISIEPDFIKFDGDIVKNILNDEKSYAFLENINNLAHSLNIKTIGQHVFSKEIFNELIELGIDYSQGYYIGKPSMTLQDECVVSTV